MKITNSKTMAVWVLFATMHTALTTTTALERLEPQEGCYIGFILGRWDTIRDLSSRLGFTPAVHTKFFDFPLNVSDEANAKIFLEQVTDVHGIAMLSLQPARGLSTVAESDCLKLAQLCASYEDQEIGGIFIRFGHEMNGNWYAWGQQPTLFKSKFQLLARSVHAKTTRTAMLWAPNYGIGYPFGKARPAPGSADFLALDTDHDGIISDRDDMYEPYYPGDDAVDWVGLTLYHWGVDYPWFENELPPAMSFAKSLVGTYQGSIPNFYDRYCAAPARNKPMAIAETAAFYNTQQGGADEFDIKQSWWRQIFKLNGDSSEALDVSAHFPKLKFINWFDEYKQESEARNSWIDWRISANARVRSAFVRDVRALRNGRPYFLTADEALCVNSPYCIGGFNLPVILPISGEITVSLDVKAETNCDLVVDLLDSDYQWRGGGRVSIVAPGQIATVRFVMKAPLQINKSYRWSIFLTPQGKDYLSAIAWYQGPEPLVKTGDLDGDGASNEQEVLAETSPQNAADLLKLQVRPAGSQVVLQWPSKIGRNYQIYATADFKVWIPASDLISGTGQPIQLTLPAAAWNRLMIYRVQAINQ